MKKVTNFKFIAMRKEFQILIGNNKKTKKKKKLNRTGNTANTSKIRNKRKNISQDINDSNETELESKVNSRKQRKVRKKQGEVQQTRTKEDVKRNIKRVFILMLVIFIIFLICYIVSLFKWYGVMKYAMRCENSLVLDSSGNVIAVVGDNRIQENVDLNNVPENLKNAYISIEDKNFKKHIGINFKRTGGAIISYVTNKGSSSYGGSTITQQVIKNVTGENETKITRKVTEWDRAIKTEILFSKDDILRTYFNVIYVGPNVYGVKMGARYYFDKNVSDLSLAECAYMAGLTHSPNSYNPFNNSDNSEKIKNRTVTVLNVMLQEGYISEEDYNNAVAETNAGLKFKQGKVEAKGEGVYSYMVDATINEAIQDLANEKHISKSFATNCLYLGGLKIRSTQNSDVQKAIENECMKNRYILRSNLNKDATSQAAMVIIDHKNRACCWMCWWAWRKNNFKRV